MRKKTDRKRAIRDFICLLKKKQFDPKTITRLEKNDPKLTLLDLSKLLLSDPDVGIVADFIAVNHTISVLNLPDISYRATSYFAPALQENTRLVSLTGRGAPLYDQLDYRDNPEYIFHYELNQQVLTYLARNDLVRSFYSYPFEVFKALKHMPEGSQLPLELIQKIIQIQVEKIRLSEKDKQHSFSTKFVPEEKPSEGVLIMSIDEVEKEHLLSQEDVHRFFATPKSMSSMLTFEVLIKERLAYQGGMLPATKYDFQIHCARGGIQIQFRHKVDLSPYDEDKQAQRDLIKNLQSLEAAATRHTDDHLNYLITTPADIQQLLQKVLGFSDKEYVDFCEQYRIEREGSRCSIM